MHKSEWLRTALPAVVGLALLTLMGMVLRRKRTLAVDTVGQIENAIATLDPVTRAAVVAKLGVDAAGQIKGRLHDGDRAADN